MRLVSFEGGFGRVDDDHVVPMGDDLVRYLTSGDVQEGEPVPLGSVRLRAPVPQPQKIVCIGLNYRDHAEETQQPIPEEPVLFAKFANSVVGQGEPVVVPPFVSEPDYEAELGVVIGRRASGLTEAEALDHVAGYTCLNDVSARDLQFRSSQWLLGKAIDGFLPCGPWLVTTDEVPNPHDLRIRCTVNDETLQDSSTSQMIFGVAELIAFVTRTIELAPGDLIATGTPPGVGMACTPPRWLENGDVMTVEIERVGALRNPVRRRSIRG